MSECLPSHGSRDLMLDAIRGPLIRSAHDIDRIADMLSTGDSPAVLISPDQYRRFTLRAEQSVFSQLREVTDKVLSLHICGNTTQVREEITLWGNIDPVGILLQGDVASVRATATEVLESVLESGHRRFVLSSGCTLPLDTPEDNLRALLRTARDTAWF